MNTDQPGTRMTLQRRFHHYDQFQYPEIMDVDGIVHGMHVPDDTPLNLSHHKLNLVLQ